MLTPLVDNGLSGTGDSGQYYELLKRIVFSPDSQVDLLIRLGYQHELLYRIHCEVCLEDNYFVISNGLLFVILMRSCLPFDGATSMF